MVEVVAVPEHLEGGGGGGDDEPDEEGSQGERDLCVLHFEKGHRAAGDGEQEHGHGQHKGVDGGAQAEVSGVEEDVIQPGSGLQGQKSIAARRLSRPVERLQITPDRQDVVDGPGWPEDPRGRRDDCLFQVSEVIDIAEDILAQALAPVAPDGADEAGKPEGQRLNNDVKDHSLIPAKARLRLNPAFY